MCTPFELHIARELLNDDSADSRGLGILAHGVTNDKSFCHLVSPFNVVTRSCVCNGLK